MPKRRTRVEPISRVSPSTISAVPETVVLAFDACAPEALKTRIAVAQTAPMQNSESLSLEVSTSQLPCRRIRLDRVLLYGGVTQASVKPYPTILSILDEQCAGK